MLPPKTGQISRFLGKICHCGCLRPLRLRMMHQARGNLYMSLGQMIPASGAEHWPAVTSLLQSLMPEGHLESLQSGSVLNKAASDTHGDVLTWTALWVGV